MGAVSYCRDDYGSCAESNGNVIHRKAWLLIDQHNRMMIGDKALARNKRFKKKKRDDS